MRLVPLALLFVCWLAWCVAPLQAQKKKDEVCPWCKHDPVLMQAAGIVPEAILDEAPLKIGQFIPGLPTPVQAFTDVVDMQGACLFVIAAWNFRAEIEAKIRSKMAGGEEILAVQAD